MDNLFNWGDEYNFKDHVMQVLFGPIAIILMLPLFVLYLVFPNKTIAILYRMKRYKRSLRAKYKPLEK